MKEIVWQISLWLVLSVFLSSCALLGSRRQRVVRKPLRPVVEQPLEESAAREKKEASKKPKTPVSAKPAKAQVVAEKVVEKAPEKASQKASEWSYLGATAPAYWGQLKSEFALCAKGRKQSPVNLSWRRPVSGGEMAFNYQKGTVGLVDKGHTLQVNFSEQQSARIRGREYILEKLLFRAKSEHTIGGKRYPMEMQMVHVNAQGDRAILSVLFSVGVAHPILGQLWSYIPSRKHEELRVEGLMINPSALLPPRTTYYHYMGSLTTPPCSEGVNWNVFNTTVSISQAQLDAFQALYQNNYRPLQPLNGRRIVNF